MMVFPLRKELSMMRYNLQGACFAQIVIHAGHCIRKDAYGFPALRNGEARGEYLSHREAKILERGTVDA